jgi:hypothetical protein
VVGLLASFEATDRVERLPGRFFAGAAVRRSVHEYTVGVKVNF